MFIKKFTFWFDSNNRIKYSIIGILTFVIIFIIIHIIFFGNCNKLNINNDNTIFNLSSYYTEYSVRIDSNKNSNIYKIKEWYKNDEKSGEKFRFETTNLNNEIITYIMSDNVLKIKNSNQKYEYVLDNYMISKKNLLSVSTFFDIYKKIESSDNCENKECCKVESVTQNNICSYKILFDNKFDNCDISKKYNENKNISCIELFVDQKNYIPVEMSIYDNTGKVYIDITYNFFDINSRFDEKLFAFLYK